MFRGTGSWRRWWQNLAVSKLMTLEIQRWVLMTTNKWWCKSDMWPYDGHNSVILARKYDWVQHLEKLNHEAGCEKIGQFYPTPMNPIFDSLWWLDWRGHRTVFQRFKIETWETDKMTAWTVLSVWLFDTWLKILERSITKL